MKIKKHSIIKKTLAIISSIIFMAFSNGINAVGSSKQLSHIKEDLRRPCTDTQGSLKMRHFFRFMIKIFENEPNEIQIRKQLEKQNGYELEVLYRHLCLPIYRASEKLRKARKMIAEVQTEKEIAKLKMKKATLSPLETAPHALRTPPVRSTMKPTSTNPQPHPKSEPSKIDSAPKPSPTKIKLHPKGVEMHRCSRCKEVIPTSERDTLFKCGNCGHERTGYLCERCKEEDCVKIISGTARNPRKCRKCGYTAKLAKA